MIYYLGKRFPLATGEWKRPLVVHLVGSLGLCAGWASLGMLAGLLLNTYPAEAPLKTAYLSWVLISLPCGPRLRPCFLILRRGDCCTRYSLVRRVKARIERVVVLSVQFRKTLASHTYKLATSWVRPKRAFPQEPQVNDSIGREIRVRDGQPGTPCGTRIATAVTKSGRVSLQLRVLCFGFL
jgi:hypothetical protein